MRFVAAICAFVACSACSKVTVGPYVPAHAQACSYDGDCPAKSACKFPRVDSHAVCMPGDNSLDQWPAPPLAF